MEHKSAPLLPFSVTGNADVCQLFQVGTNQEYLAKFYLVKGKTGTFNLV